MSRPEPTRKLFRGEPVILNLAQMTRTTPKPAPSSLNFRTTPEKEVLIFGVTFNVHQVHMHQGSLAESVFEPETLRPRSQEHQTTGA
ncbi:hypothetical protein AVEN_187478-1 [Araneus ventricosus]|uniref:Uncharacterized protein n=1 Tax=Araneus ventricosus TaxID=182803 RepID=A0A4Y2BU31_ARAVE|nr:hypothetical protein AVEN_187478-1 [Araneus ventricosus]